MNWAQVTPKRQQQAQVYESTIYFYIHACISTAVMNFSYKFFKSFVICKTVSKLAVTYVPSVGGMCTGQQALWLARRLVTSCKALLTLSIRTVNILAFPPIAGLWKVQAGGYIYNSSFHKTLYQRQRENISGSPDFNFKVTHHNCDFEHGWISTLQ